MSMGGGSPVSSPSQQGLPSVGQQQTNAQDPSGLLDQLARLYLGDPWEQIARAGESVSFHSPRPNEREGEYLQRHYNTAPAAPYIGPGISGLQGLLMQLVRGG